MKMTATQMLPVDYKLIHTIDIRQTKGLVIMNILAVIILIASWIGFTRLAAAIRPELQTTIFTFSIEKPIQLLIDLANLVVVTVVMIVVHEAFHGHCFWLFTRSKPKFAFKFYYAYASAPDWYLPRWQYLITGLAPLVGITAICVGLMFIVPAWLMPSLLWMLVFNTSGAAGDLWMVWRLLRSPRGVLARDKGDVLEFFAPGNFKS